MFQDKDQHIYYLRRLYFCHNLNLLRILVYIRNKDLQSIRLNMRKIQHHYVLYKWH